jgi:hypothetical protein
MLLSSWSKTLTILSEISKLIIAWTVPSSRRRLAGFLGQPQG